MKAVIVCGGRNYLNIDKVFAALDKANPDVIITGACPTGADQYAERWAKANQRNYIGFPARWDKHGKSAGPRRNQSIIEFVKRYFPEYWSCITFPGGAGTADMVGRCMANEIQVIVEVDDD